MATGKVKLFNAEEGFWFIVCDDGEPDVFVHVTAVQDAGMDTLLADQLLYPCESSNDTGCYSGQWTTPVLRSAGQPLSPSKGCGLSSTTIDRNLYAASL